MTWPEQSQLTWRCQAWGFNTIITFSPTTNTRHNPSPPLTTFNYEASLCKSNIDLLAHRPFVKLQSKSCFTPVTSKTKRTRTRLICFNVKTNCFMWNKIFRSKVYCMENVCWANEVHFMEYLNIWSTLLNINTIRIKEKTKKRQKQYQHH